VGKLESMEARIEKLENQVHALKVVLKMQAVKVDCYTCHKCGEITLEGDDIEVGPHQYVWYCSSCLSTRER